MQLQLQDKFQTIHSPPFNPLCLSDILEQALGNHQDTVGARGAGGIPHGEHAVRGEGSPFKGYSTGGVSNGDQEGTSGEKGRTSGEHGVIDAKGGGSVAFYDNRDHDFVHQVQHMVHIFICLLLS